MADPWMILAVMSSSEDCLVIEHDAVRMVTEKVVQPVVDMVRQLELGKFAKQCSMS